MKRILFVFILFPSLCVFAKDEHFDGMRIRENKGMITVLEAPLFKTADQSTKVVQYVRKGEEIYIHPAEFHIDRYDGLIEKSREDVQAYRPKYASEHKDPLFANEGDVYDPEPGSLFYKTMSADGKDAYILKEHVFLLYNDIREMDQDVVKDDPTDYRIAEPLPKGFPLTQPTGYRGYVSYGLGTPGDSPYTYPGKIEDTGFGFLNELSVVWSKTPETLMDNRFWFGGMINLALYELEYKLDDRSSKERNFKLSVGPYASYDIWRRKNFILNAFGSIQFVFLDMVDIEQKGENGESDARSFSSYHFSPRVGLNFQKPKSVFELDFVGGVSMNMELEHNYTTSDGSEQDSWWKGDEFARPSRTQLTYFLGLQSSY